MEEQLTFDGITEYVDTTGHTVTNATISSNWDQSNLQDILNSNEEAIKRWKEEFVCHFGDNATVTLPSTIGETMHVSFKVPVPVEHINFQFCVDKDGWRVLTDEPVSNEDRYVSVMNSMGLNVSR